VIAVLCLALGIGAVSTIFGIVDSLFFRPPPGVSSAATLVRPYIIRKTGSIQGTGEATSYPEYLDLRDNARSLSGVAAFANVSLSVGEGGDASSAEGMLVSQSYFNVLGVKPAAGRFFVPEEDKGPGSPPAVVLSHAFWQQKFGGDRSAVGKTLLIAGRSWQIVGVAPPRFRGLDAGQPDLWLPFTQAAHLGYDEDMLANRWSIWLRIVGRLAPGVTRARAQAEIKSIVWHVAESNPSFDPHPEVVLGPIFAARGPSPSMQARIARWLAVAAMFVLTIACANAANLLLARAATRRREIAIRLSVGASRGRVVRQLLVESLLLAGLAAVLGMLIALWATDLVPVTGLPPLGLFARGRVLGFTVAVGTLCGLFFGIVPALWATRADLASVMKEGVREGVDRRSRLRAAFMIVQVALAVVLLTGAGLFVHSLRNVQDVNVGWDIRPLLHGSVDLGSTGLSDSAAVTFPARALDRLRAVPGIVDASLIQGIPLSGSMMSMGYTIPGSAVPARGTHPQGATTSASTSHPITWMVGSHFFSTMGIPLRAGRDFTDGDRLGSMPVAIVDETFARREWPGKSALGECIELGNRKQPTCYTVVGISANANLVSLEVQDFPEFFLPIAQYPGSSTRYQAFLIRTAGTPTHMTSAVRAALNELQPNLPYIELQTLPDILRPILQPRRLGASIFAVFGALALLLAAIGLYGVIAYGVAQRTHEMGIRLALGARPRDVVRLVVRQGVVLSVAGLVIGIAGALVAARLLKSLLFGVSTLDPATFAGVVLLLAAAATLASWIPARRATQVDPMVALRSE
jgi:predicted permease